MLIYIIIGIIAYLIGSVNFSVIISKRVAGFDVREKGSGNAGTTNMLRSVGKGAAAITLICDILKGVVAIGIAILLGNILKGLQPSHYTEALHAERSGSEVGAVTMGTEGRNFLLSP